jgi:hypothetical protein
VIANDPLAHQPFGALTERRFRDFLLGVGAVAVVALLGAVALGFGTLAAYL